MTDNNNIREISNGNFNDAKHNNNESTIGSSFTINLSINDNNNYDDDNFICRPPVASSKFIKKESSHDD